MNQDIILYTIVAVGAYYDEIRLSLEDDREVKAIRAKAIRLGISKKRVK